MTETLRDQVCTPEQMIELKNLGIDITKASACLLTMKLADGSDQTIVTEPCNLYGKAAIPVFTITDLLALMPTKVQNIISRYSFCEGWLTMLKFSGSYKCRYQIRTDRRTGNAGYFHNSENPTLLNAIYGTLLFLIEDGRIIKPKKEGDNMDCVEEDYSEEELKGKSLEDCSTCAHYKEKYGGSCNSGMPSRRCQAEAEAPYFIGRDLWWDYPVKNCNKYKNRSNE